ncbi:MAG: CHAP domain-containing protein [Patescibacteria group bacterium]|jgi:surface antigen
MILQDDVEPPHKRSGNSKIKNFTLKLSKTKNHLNKYFDELAKAKKLAATGYKATAIFCGQNISAFKKMQKTGIISEYLPHAVVTALTLIVVGSNFVVQARAKNSDSLVPAEPEQEIAVAASVDQYTPLIPDGHVNVEKAYLASSQSFTEVKTTVDTNITAREEPLPDNSSGSVQYTVRSGDTLTGLGWKFGVRLASIKYVNNMGSSDLIKPGQTIKIPQAGYEVSDSAYAAQQAKLAVASRSTVNRSSSSSRSKTTSISHPAGSRNNGYPYGYCTYYVATRRSMPTSMGNAKNWLSSARSRGMSTGSTPAVGAIVVTSESWWGHVAYVESVNGNSLTISEMNYAGWGVVSRRTISAGEGAIRGFIY